MKLNITHGTAVMTSPRVPRMDPTAVEPTQGFNAPRAQGLSAEAFGAGVGAGMQSAGQSLQNVALMVKRDLNEKAAQQEKFIREHSADLLKKQEEIDTNAAKNYLLSFDTALFDEQNRLIEDPDTHPTDYPLKLNTFAENYIGEVSAKIPAHVWQKIQPTFREKGLNAAQRIHEKGMTELNDKSWAEEIVAADALVNNPVKTAAEKIAILQSPELFAGSGRPQHEVESERQRRIALAADIEVKSLFNAAGSNPEFLQKVKTHLTATNQDGSFSYLPQMPQKAREEYISNLQTKIEHTEQQAEVERKRLEAQGRQAGQELIIEYREKVNSGWMPHTKEDYSFVNQVKRAASASPSLSRQYNDATVKMTSFASREQFRATDPLGTAAAEKGIILAPLNVTAPMGPQLEKRATIANQLGVKSLFKGDEINALADGLAKKDAVEQLKSIKDLSGQLGGWASNTFSAAAEQLKSKDAGLSTMFKLAAGGDMHAVKLYATGRQFLLSEKKDLLKEKVTTLKTALDEKLEEKLGTAMKALPQSRNAIKDAAAIAYIGAATSQGLSLDVIDGGILADVQKRIIGETVRTGNQWMGAGGSWKTTVIPKGITGDEFLNGIKAITPVSIQLSGGVDGMSDEEAAKFLKKAAWHELGNGYGFYKDGKLLMGKDGKPFIWRQ
jgi:hypothetical protein